MKPPGVMNRRLAPSEVRLVKDRIAQARTASARCRGHLEQVCVRSEPGDPRLREFLCGLAIEETRTELRLGTLDPGGMPGNAPPTFDRLGDGWLDRDAALYLVEGVEEERTRTFSGLARGLPVGEARALLLREADRGRPRLILLRNILFEEERGIRSDAALSCQLRSWLIDALAGLVNQVRDGEDYICDLRSVYDSGVAAGPKSDGPYALLLDVLGRSPRDGEIPLCDGLGRLAGAGTATDVVQIARQLLAVLLIYPS